MPSTWNKHPIIFSKILRARENDERGWNSAGLALVKTNIDTWAWQLEYRNVCWLWVNCKFFIYFFETPQKNIYLVWKAGNVLGKCGISQQELRKGIASLSVQEGIGFVEQQFSVWSTRRLGFQQDNQRRSVNDCNVETRGKINKGLIHKPILPVLLFSYPTTCKSPCPAAMLFYSCVPHQLEEERCTELQSDLPHQRSIAMVNIQTVQAWASRQNGGSMEATWDKVTYDWVLVHLLKSDPEDHQDRLWGERKQSGQFFSWAQSASRKPLTVWWTWLP